jgi:putative addiction module component (TIGR02574 family)
MSVNCRDVLDAALQLSAEERGMIAERLLETLSPEDAELGDDDLAVELERRLEQAHNDPSTVVTWSDLRSTTTSSTVQTS